MSEVDRVTAWLAGEKSCPDLDEKAERRISCAKYRVSNYHRFSDGFSFTVATEVEAYRAAYDWQHVLKTVVREAPSVGGWLVQVYEKDRLNNPEKT